MSPRRGSCGPAKKKKKYGLDCVYVSALLGCCKMRGRAVRVTFSACVYRVEISSVDMDVVGRVLVAQSSALVTKVAALL